MLSEEDLILGLSDEDAEYVVVLEPKLQAEWIDQRKGASA